MFNEKHYVPILKWKRGEQKALELLSEKCKNTITPLIEIVPVPYDFVNERPAKTIDEHLKNISDQILTSWGTKRPLFLDLFWVDEEERMEDGRHPLAFIMDEANKHGLHIIPVIGTGRDENYNKEIKKVIQKIKKGVCLRLEDEDFLDVESSITTILEITGAKPNVVDLLIDFGPISDKEDSNHILSAISVINSIPDINKWRTFTLSGSAFPENLSSISTDSVGSIQRSEWIMWQGILKRSSRIKRLPTFSDYVISHPIYSEVDPRIMQMTANIRYTSNDKFIIFKGKTIKKHGWEQIFNLCKKAVRHPEYCGKEFCWGDKYIFDCAGQKCSTGNAETWRRVGTNHHITFVVEQLSSFFEV